MTKGLWCLMEGLKELVEYGVIGLLLGLSFWAIGVAVERWLILPAGGRSSSFPRWICARSR